jgi:hypothetical protein
MKKMTKYQTGILLGIAAVIIVAYLDIVSGRSGLFASMVEYTNGNFCSCWAGLFRTIALALFMIVPAAYFFLAKRDFSESIAIFISSYVMWMFGLADIFYFWLQKLPVPSVMPWLQGHPIISKFTFVSQGVVTPITLYLSVIFGLVVVYGITKYLEKIN